MESCPSLLAHGSLAVHAPDNALETLNFRFIGLAHLLHLEEQRGARLFHLLLDLQDRLDARQVDFARADKMFDSIKTLDVVQGVVPDLAHAALGLNQPDALVVAQRLRVHVDHLGSDADREARLTLHASRRLAAVRLIHRVSLPRRLAFGVRRSDWSQGTVRTPNAARRTPNHWPRRAALRTTAARGRS